jgi:hypothetical protein
LLFFQRRGVFWSSSRRAMEERRKKSKIKKRVSRVGGVCISC